MWFEVLPSLAIVGAAVAVPQIVAYYINTWTLGNPMRRDLRKLWDRQMFTRDDRLTGGVWRTAGLENIPDA